VHFDGESTPRDLPKEAEVDLELAYAITCHKAQGSSAATVVLMTDDGALVTREWLYTGVTRARNLVLLSVENQESLGVAIGRRIQRTTGFRL
jgi:exodeoxyribonuclease V alpha subunit